MVDNLQHQSAEKTSTKLHRRLTAGLQLVMAIGFALSLYERQWMNAALILGIIVFTLVPTFISRRYQVFIPPEFQIPAIIFVFASIFLGEIRGYYARFPWWDLVLHIGSGLLLGMVGFLLVYVLNEQERIHIHLNPGFLAFFAFTFSVAGGAIWEIFEFVGDQLLGTNMQKSGLVDTMWDLIVDTIGALIIAIAGYYAIRDPREYMIERWIKSFILANPRLFRRHRKRRAKAADASK